MRDYAEAVLNHLDRREVEYADVRVIESRERNISTKNGKVGTSSSDESLGLGVRVLAQGCWGFASTDDLSKDSLAAVAANLDDALANRCHAPHIEGTQLAAARVDRQ